MREYVFSWQFHSVSVSFFGEWKEVLINVLAGIEMRRSVEVFGKV